MAKKSTSQTSGRSKGKKVSVKKQEKKSLMDDRLKRSSEDDFRMVSIFAGVLFVAALILFVGYFLYYRSQLSPEYNPNVALPEIEIDVPQEQATSTDDIVEPEDETNEPEIITQRVQVTDTGIGYLNVRSGPSTSFEKIGEAQPGEIFDLVSIDEQAGWYEIRFTEDQNGWVINQYAEIVENEE